MSDFWSGRLFYRVASYRKEFGRQPFWSKERRSGRLWLRIKSQRISTGYSHRPDEYASPDDIVRGTLVLAETLAALAS
jgi:hypothetical protein